MSRNKPNHTGCRIGKWCEEHACVHGGEAEELRRGVERLIADGGGTAGELQALLDRVDARDSLAFLENDSLPCIALTQSGRRCRNRHGGPMPWCHQHRQLGATDMS